MEYTFTTDNFETEVLGSDVPVLVDFWATWCMPCRMLAPVIEEIASENEGKIKVGKVNVDENPDLARKYRVMSIPTVLVFKNGELVYDKPSLQDIRSYCKQQIDTLWDEVLRFENPHNYYVDLSRKLWDIKHELLDNGGVLRARDGRERS